MRSRATPLLIALAAGSALLLTGCSSPSEQAAAPKAEGVEFVVGAHANGPAPDVTQELQARIMAAIEGGQPIGAIAVDGAPRVLIPATTFVSQGNNANKRAASAVQYANGVIGALRAAKPSAPGADLLTGLLRAADAARTATPAIRDIVVIDNGLSDSGPLDFTRKGMSEAPGSEVAKALLERQEITKSSFAGLRVKFVGLATAVAKPQPALAQPQVTAVSSIYRSIIEAGGGTATLVPVPRSGPAVETDLPVRVVAPQRAALTFGGTEAFGDGSAIAFTPGTANFRDPAAARALLKPLASWLAPGNSHTAVIVGTTSSEGNVSKSSDLRLSSARATAVKTMLVSMGADAGKIKASGKGYIADPPDRVDGVIDPAKAALNRVVRITTKY